MKVFKTLALLTALAISTTSCADLKSFGSAVSAGVSIASGTSVDQQKVAAGVVAFDVAQDGATTWMKLPDCATGQTIIANTCKDGTKKATVAKAVRDGRKARDIIWTASKGTTTGIGAVTLFNTMVQATAAIRDVI